jgi:adenylylsulfate kinase
MRAVHHAHVDGTTCGLSCPCHTGEDICAPRLPADTHGRRMMDPGQPTACRHPATIWITGLPASGKSTLSQQLCEVLREEDVCSPVLIDGEHMRARLGNRYGHGLADRRTMLQHTVMEAVRLRRSGRTVIVATISHTRAMRRYARTRLQPFFEVFLDCPWQVCAARDVKGNYARALQGEYDCFVGVTHAYERWQRRLPELELDTATLDVGESMRRLRAASTPFIEKATASAVYT